MEHYFDNAATTKTCNEAIKAAVNVMENIYGNPSSTHTLGRLAKTELENCRKTVADALGAKNTEIVFTSCGSESDNFAIIKGAKALRRKGKHIISSSVEHDAVRNSLKFLEEQGYEITRLNPDNTGKISVESVKNALREDTVLVSLMLVNNETGAVNDIGGISQMLKEEGSCALLHTDAVQGFMKIPFRAKTLGADMISISGHKIHAPKGIGALYIRNGLKLNPIILGGGQENGLRAGTENLPNIAAFAAAVRQNPETEKIAEIKSSLTEKLVANIPELKYIKTAAPHILNISMPGWRSEVLMNFLEAREIYVSKSSACKQGKRSHVLEAIGLSNDYIDGALRIGISRFNTNDDVDSLVKGLTAARKLAHK